MVEIDNGYHKQTGAVFKNLEFINNYMACIKIRDEKPFANWYIDKRGRINFRDTRGKFIPQKKALEVLFYQANRLPNTQMSSEPDLGIDTDM